MLLSLCPLFFLSVFLSIFLSFFLSFCRSLRPICFLQSFSLSLSLSLSLALSLSLSLYVVLWFFRCFFLFLSVSLSFRCFVLSLSKKCQKHVEHTSNSMALTSCRSILLIVSWLYETLYLGPEQTLSESSVHLQSGPTVLNNHGTVAHTRRTCTR